jgi:multidrug efflux pump subunit AcrA (membrane-fusion protein)
LHYNCRTEKLQDPAVCLLTPERLTMILDKPKSLQLIYRRLDTVTQKIAALDAANAKVSAIQAEHAKLRAIGSDLLAEDSTKPEELAQFRAKVDLLSAKLERASKAVLDAERVVVEAAETATLPIEAFKQGAVAAYWDKFTSGCGGYFDKDDVPHVIRQFASRNANAKALAHAELIHFSPRTPGQRAMDLPNARRLSLAVADLERSAEGLDFSTDIPPQWAE